MINCRTSASEKSEMEWEKQIKKSFPKIDTKKAYKLLNNYTEAYCTAIEYFALYFCGTTKTVINYIDSSDFKYTWNLIMDSLFSEGINALYQFIDPQSKNHRNIFNRSKCIFGQPIFQEDNFFKNLPRYRNNKIAHYGNSFDKEEIMYDNIIVALEHLRRDRFIFNKKYNLPSEIIYENGSLQESFFGKITDIDSLLNLNKASSIKENLTEYLSNVIE